MSEFARKRCLHQSIYFAKDFQPSFRCIWTIAEGSDLTRPRTTCISDSYSGKYIRIDIKSLFIPLTLKQYFLFRILFRTLNHQMDYVFDWTIHKQKLEKNKKLWFLNFQKFWKIFVFTTAKEPIIVRVKSDTPMNHYLYFIQYRLDEILSSLPNRPFCPLAFYIYNICYWSWTFQVFESLCQRLADSGHGPRNFFSFNFESVTWPVNPHAGRMLAAGNREATTFEKCTTNSQS